jgi:hypothetical protein
MPVIRASQRQVETIETSAPGVLNREEWISEPGELSQFGAFIHVLMPQSDRITYPDHDRVLHRDRSQPDDIWTDSSGRVAESPYKRWTP